MPDSALAWHSTTPPNLNHLEQYVLPSNRITEGWGGKPGNKCAVFCKVCIREITFFQEFCWCAVCLLATWYLNLLPKVSPEHNTYWKTWEWRGWEFPWKTYESIRQLVKKKKKCFLMSNTIGLLGVSEEGQISDTYQNWTFWLLWRNDLNMII